MKDEAMGDNVVKDDVAMNDTRLMKVTGMIIL